MSYNYRIQFKSLRSGTLYSVNIGGGTSNIVWDLKAGAQPFVTEEDNDDDMFAPIRTQTGYLRIVDDGYDADGYSFNWKDLIPATDTSRPVTLTANNTVLWQGYLQAQDFSGTLYGNPQEREFPIQCALATLSSQNIPTNVRSLKNFAYIIKTVFDSLTDMTFSTFVFQGGSDARDWLKKMVDWQNFVVEDDDNILSSRFDNLTVLEDICKFWGWTCRIQGTTVYFARPDDSDHTTALVLTYANLSTLAGGTDAGTTSETFAQSLSMYGDIYASTNNTETFVRGYSKARVSSNAGDGDSNVIDLYPKSVEDDMMGTTGYTETIDDKRCKYTTDKTSFSSSFLTGSAASGYGSFNLAHYYDINDDNTMPCVRIKKSYDGTTMASVETLFSHAFYDENNRQFFNEAGALCLKGTVYYKNDKLQTESVMYAYIGIGETRGTALWFTGTGWSSTKTAITLRIGRAGDSDYFYYKYTTGSASYVSKYIPTNNAALHGKIFIDFLGTDQLDEVSALSNQRAFTINNFQVVFQRTGTIDLMNQYQDNRKTTVTYKASNSNKVTNEYENDLAYASDNTMSFGYGVIIGEDYKPLQMLTYGSTDMYPEQNLANRVAAFWSSSKQMKEVEVRANAIGTPSPRSVSSGFYVLSIGRDWRDDIIKLKLIEL